MRPRNPRDRFEHAGLALPVRTVNHGEPGIQLEIDALQATKIVEPEVTDPRDRASRGLGEHRRQDVRTGISRYRKSPLSAACNVAGFKRIDGLEHDLFGVDRVDAVVQERRVERDGQLGSLELRVDRLLRVPDVLRRHRQLEPARRSS